jgi:hypothetical protein
MQQRGGRDMREDEERIRHFVPVLRRTIILVAVLAAIPVAMWTVTAAVRTYVGPPKLPTFRPLAAVPVGTAPGEATAAPAPAAETATGSDQTSTAALATVDGGKSNAMAPASPQPSGPVPAFGPGRGRTAKADTSAASPAIMASNDPSTARAPNSAMPFAAEQQSPAANWPSPPPSADVAPTGEPISGPVPLPRKRPRMVAIAQQTGIPLPRPRPDEAGPPAPVAPQTPFAWLHKIFQPQSAAAASPPAEEDNYVATPH